MSYLDKRPKDKAFRRFIKSVEKQKKDQDEIIKGRTVWKACGQACRDESKAKYKTCPHALPFPYKGYNDYRGHTALR